LLGILTPSEALTGFSNPIVIMMVALFIVGGAIFQTGLAKSVSTYLLQFAGKSKIKIFFLIMLVTALFGSFVSNTGTVALLMPVVISMAKMAEVNSRRLLMPMAFASSMGGMMTLIGTPPNMIISNTLAENGFEPLSFFSFTPVGIITVVVGVGSMWFLTKVLDKTDRKNKRGDDESGVKSPQQLINEYQIAENLFRVEVLKDTSILNKKLNELTVTQEYDISVIEIRKLPSYNKRRPFNHIDEQKMARPESIIEDGDYLYIFGNFENVQKFVLDYNLRFVDAREKQRPIFSGKFKFSEIGIAEVVVMSNSKHVNKSVRETGFRKNYYVNVLSIRRRDSFIYKNIKDVVIQSGDVLLVQGDWRDIARLNREESDIVVVGQPETEASKVLLDHKAPIAATIMILMVITMSFNILEPVIATLLAALAMILTGCFRNVEAAYRTINWESIFLFAAMIPLAIAMEKTGASAAISGGIVGALNPYGPVLVMAGIYLATSFLTMFISNTATAVLFAPIAMQTALTLGVSPYPFLFAVTVAASMCFASPFSTPPNALVMSAGRYKFMDYVKVGLPLQTILMIIMIFVLPLLFPF
jgi:di/tricarboxylate transporter